ncbi:hypothetical protein ANN_06013 [Periplaneta americana]|uniref:Conserved oligomeric Golgi complex subunit 2 n=1 Tax=Periplaneta americana TaxID=6978 RepID=A0ABQ8TCD4_PERAM|nr:hypothetical protein ANN_06013 [Periplaneta americana]
MSKDNETFPLPVGPNDLCFDKNEFIKKSFSVDQFLQNHRKKANLETLRDDLGIYLKVLRSAMIELINKDYADFVNLSSNLIGLDKAINGIQVPLGQLKEEVLQVKLNLDEAMEDLSFRLDQRRQIRARKRSLQSLARVQSSLSKWSTLLHLDESDNEKNAERLQLDPGLVERAASEFNQLQFCISKCEKDLTESHKQRAEKIRDLLTSSLDGMFLGSLRERDSEGMARCLRIYITLDKTADVEALFRREVVSPALHDVVSESSLQSDPRGLQGVYSRILSFIDTHMDQLLKLTARGVSMPAVRGFDFLVNSFWPEVEQRLELHLPSIYAPGNPEMFYQRYCETLEFLEKLERYCGTQVGVKRLHAHPQYIAFLQRWNLPVYFQIRFQEIAGTLENAMSEGNPQVLSGGPAPTDFQLRITTTAWDCLMRCWANGVFLEQLTHRFWKLNLQILARYYTWVGEALEQKWPSDSVGSGAVSVNGSESSGSQKLQFLVHLYTDVEKLVARLPNLLDHVMPRMGNLSQQGQDLLKSSLKESEQQLLTRLPLITQFILGEISGQSLPHLRQVSDIPRLFRRTNREMPSKPCSYVALVLALPLAFHSTQKSIVNPELLTQWLMLTFSAVTQQFFSSVDDVLTSVQKTEESLRRLKKIRDRSTATASSEAKGIGDDDKIRHQLLLDVYSYCEGIESVGVTRKNVDKLEELVALVESARTKSDTSK